MKQAEGLILSAQRWNLRRRKAASKFLMNQTEGLILFRAMLEFVLPQNAAGGAAPRERISNESSQKLDSIRTTLEFAAPRKRRERAEALTANF